MTVNAIGPYEFPPLDLEANFHGNRLLYVGWDRHLMFCSPFALAVNPAMGFAELCEQVLRPAMAEGGVGRIMVIPGGPVMLAAARDSVVSTAAIEQLGLQMRTGRHMVIAGARHELFMENDAIRGQVLAAFDAFITEQTR